MTVSRNQIFIIIIEFVLTILCGYFLGKLFVVSLDPLPLSDFHVYYYIPKAVLTLARPEHPYTNFVPIYPFFYPPGSLFLFYPFLGFPFYIAKILWTVINASLLLYSAYLINALLAKRNRITFFLLVLSAVKFLPVKFTMIDGQFNLILLFIYTYGLHALINHKNVKGGILLGIGCISKISPLLIAFYAFYNRRYKIILVTIFTILFFVTLAEIFIQRGINFYYLRYVLYHVSSQANSPSWRDQSLLGLIKRFEISEQIQILKFQIAQSHIRSMISYSIIGLIIASFGYLNFKIRKSMLDIYVSYFILTIVAFIGTGLTWFHQYTILLLPLWGLFLISLFWIKGKIGYLFVAFSIGVYFLCNLYLESVKNVFLQMNMFYSGVLLLVILIILKIKSGLILNKAKDLKIFENLKAKLPNRILLMIFALIFIFSLSPFTLSEIMKEHRDKARVSNVNFMAEILINKTPEFEVGSSNSYLQTEKLDEGYILFQKNEENKVRKYMSILYLDPINNETYNYAFESDGDNFVLSAKLESKKYIKDLGENFMYKSSEKKRTWEN